MSLPFQGRSPATGAFTPPLGCGKIRPTSLPLPLPLPRAIALSLALLLAGCGGDAGAPGAPVQWSGESLDGTRVELAALRGEVVLLNIWATWCLPCRREMPALQQLHQRLGDRGLQVLGVSVDRGGAREAIVEFVDALGLTFPILLDPDQRIMARFRTIGVPETYLLDREGAVAFRWIGEFDPMDPAVLSRIESLLEAE